MLFQGKINRVLDPEKSQKKFRKTLEKERLEKKDVPAMILAAIIVFLPAFVLVAGLFGLAIWLFFS